MTLYPFGGVILIPFLFTDQSGVKQRPAVVISSSAYPAKPDGNSFSQRSVDAAADDRVVCGVRLGEKGFSTTEAKSCTGWLATSVGSQFRRIMYR